MADPRRGTTSYLGFRRAASKLHTVGAVIYTSAAGDVIRRVFEDHERLVKLAWSAVLKRRGSWLLYTTLNSKGQGGPALARRADPERRP